MKYKYECKNCGHVAKPRHSRKVWTCTVCLKGQVGKKIKE